MNFAKIKDGGSALEYAPDMIWPNPNPPTDEEYAAAGYLPVVDAPPSEPAQDGYHWDARGWEYRDGSIHRVYDEVADPSPTLSDYDNAMEDHLKSERYARGYTTREPDVYLSSSVPRWAQDATDWIAHRDAVMVYALGVMNDVESGKIEPPQLETFIENLPTIEWSFPE